MRQRLLIFIVSYEAERTTKKVLSRIPMDLDAYEVEILLVDDASQDQTFDKALDSQQSGRCPYPLTLLSNPVNRGYGGNQKIGYRYAIDNGFHMVALLHGDGQYAPERLPDLVDALTQNNADAVFGSRFMTRGGTLRGGMPLYKYVGNRILSGMQNLLLGAGLSEYHSGYRVYRTSALMAIPFELNSNDFHFDTEIIIQLLRAGKSIHERAIPTYYGDEISHVNGLGYAWNVLRVTVASRMMDFGVLYQRRFDVAAHQGEAPYQSKVAFDSSHSQAVRRVPAGARVLDIGCGSGMGGITESGV